MKKISKEIQKSVEMYIKRLGGIEQTKIAIAETITELSKDSYAYGNKNQILFYAKCLFQIEKLEQNANN